MFPPIFWILAGIAALVAVSNKSTPTDQGGGGDDPGKPQPPTPGGPSAEPTDDSSDPSDPGAIVAPSRTPQYDAFLTAYSMTPYHAAIAQAEQANGIPENLYARQLYAESRFQPGAVSPAGAQGIAQFMPATAAQYGIDPLDPNQAIPAGAQYVAALAQQFGDWYSALVAYNWGPGHVTAKGVDAAPPVSVAYANDILADSEA